MNTFIHDHRDLDVVPGLRREWMIVVRHRRLILSTTLLGLVGALIFNYAVRPLYASVAVVSVSETVPGQPNARLNLNLPRLEAVINEQMGLLTGREFAARVVSGATPALMAELATGPIGGWYERLRFGQGGDPAQAAQVNKAQAVGAIRSRLKLEWKEPSTWIEVRVTAYDPDAAAELANAVVKRYTSETADVNRRTSEESLSSFETQVETKGKQLGEQLSGLRELGAETGLGDLAARRAMLERQIKGFQDALVAAQTTRVGRAASTREAAQLEGGALGDPRVQAARTRLSELEDREKELLATLGALHPDVVTVQGQVESARVRLAEATASVQRAADAAYEVAVKEEARIEASLTRAQRELARLDSRSLDYTLTQKKADASRTAVEQLIQRQETTMAVILETEIVQAAVPAAIPISPQKKQNVAYSLIGGLLAGLALAWMRERFDDSIQTPDDIKDILGLPFLGVVPMVPELSGGTMAQALADTPTGFSDGLRLVRTNLMYGAPQMNARVLVFTSASPGDGKSTVASGVALLLHETQARVLVIDGDLRRPTLHDLLETPQSPGLSDLLAAPPPVKLAVSKSAVPSVDVLTAGPPLTVSAARLGSENMRSLIAQARESYDWIIIDSPPSLGLPDASVLATLSDAVVVVCSGDKTPRQALKSVTDQLRAVGGTVIGVVLNRVNMNRHSYYYGRYYSPYYGDKRVAERRPERSSTP